MDAGGQGLGPLRGRARPRLLTLPRGLWVLGGAFNCGKAQPGQVAAVSHGCPTALFRGVNILNTTQEGGQ